MPVDLRRAQTLFEGLSPALRWPTMSPLYAATDALRDPALEPVFLHCEAAGGLLLHGVHQAGIPGHPGVDWQSPYGYGGPLVDGLDGSALDAAWARVDRQAHDRGVVAEFVRFHPGLPSHRHYPGTVRANRPVVMVDLTLVDLLASYAGRARTAVKKALRSGLQPEWLTPAAAQAAFPAFYRRSMAAIGADDFYHFNDEYFGALLALPFAQVLAIRLEDELLAMGLFLVGPLQMEYHLSGTSPQGREMGATNLLIHAAAQEAQARGCRALYLGGGLGGQPDDALLRFKSSFAQPQHMFHIGHRVFDEAAYAELRRIHGVPPGGEKRVLFYRS